MRSDQDAPDESTPGADAERAGAWRFVPGVRSHERSRFLLFASLSALLSLAQTLGLAGGEALLIGRLGVGALPAAFVAAAAASVLASLAYASFVGRVRNDVTTLVMLVVGGVLLLAGALAVQRSLPGSEVALFGAYFVFEATVSNHFWTFAGDHFDLRASRRVFPLLVMAASIGGVVGGGTATIVSRLGPPVLLIAGWGIVMLLAALLVRIARSRLMRWGPLSSEEQDETSVSGLSAAFRYAQQSRMGRALVVSCFTMVTALFLLQYLYSDVFARSFDSPAELAAFFGVFLLVSNGIELVLEALLPRVIRRIGPANANLIHPVMTLASFAALAASFRLPAAVAARVNREALDNAVSDPVRSLVYNALPPRLRGRMRALLEGIVVYSGMGLAGAALLVWPEPDPSLVTVAGASLALAYLLANLVVRRAYLDSLVEQLRSGRLDLDALGAGIGSAELERLAALWVGLLDDPEPPMASLLELAPLLARRGLIDSLETGARHGDARVRRASVAALATSDADAATAALRRALDDPAAEVRVEAVRGLARHGGADVAVRSVLQRRLSDADIDVRAEAAAALGNEGEAELARLARSRAPGEAVAALQRLPAGLRAAALDRVEDPDPAVRAAALRCSLRIGAADTLEPGRVESALGHPEPEVRRAGVEVLAARRSGASTLALAAALDDPARSVRHLAARALGAAGDEGLAAACERLDAERATTASAALRALGRSPSQQARPMLIDAFRGFVLRAWDHLLAIHALADASDLPARYLRAAHLDAWVRARELAFRALGWVENPGLVRSLQRTLRLGAPSARAEALEVLSNLGERESAELFSLMHEEGALEDRLRDVPRFGARPRAPADVVEAAPASPDRWVRFAIEAASGDGDEEQRESMERLLALRKVPLFRGSSFDQLEAIAKVMKEEEYVAGEMILREGDPGSDLYVLVEGEVAIYRDYDTPAATEVNRLSPVTSFGEMAVLADERRSATVVVTRDARLVVLAGSRLKELILQMPEISFDLFRGLIDRIQAAESRGHARPRADD